MKSLYVTDRPSVGGQRLAAVLEALARAPSLTVQVRERDATDRERLEWVEFARRTLSADVPVYVNARFDVALAAGTQGVHLPASGLPSRRVRTATPREFRIGLSTHSADEAREAIASGVDLVLIGPIFETPSKREFGSPLGEGVLADLPRLSEHAAEVYAIGGIDERNLSRLHPHRERISGIAGIRIFQDAPDPGAVARRIAES